MLAHTPPTGHTGTGIANSLGASSLGILLALGVPWAITLVLQIADGEEGVVPLHGSGVAYTISMLAPVALTLFVILSVSRFRLMKSTGVALGTAYLLFISFAVLAELGFVYPSNC